MKILIVLFLFTSSHLYAGPGNAKRKEMREDFSNYEKRQMKKANKELKKARREAREDGVISKEERKEIRKELKQRNRKFKRFSNNDKNE